MKHYYDQVINQFGVPVPGATVSVFLTGTQTKASLFSDDGVTPLTNPFTADAVGRFFFYVADGRYDITITGSNIVTFTQSNVEIIDITEANAGDAPVWNISSGGVFKWGTDIGLSRIAGGPYIAVGNGIAGDVSGNFQAAVILQSADFARLLNPGLRLSSNGIIQFANTTSSGATPDVGISRTGVGLLAIGNGSVGDASGQIVAATIAQSADTARFNSGTGVVIAGTTKVLGFTSSGVSSGTVDVALSRSAAGEVAIGTGAQGNAGGNLKLNTITSIGGMATSGGFGVPGTVATFSATNISASTGTLNALASAPAGVYRLSVYGYVTTAGSGGTLSIVITYNNGIAGTSKSVGGINLAALSDGFNSVVFRNGASQSIQYALTFVGPTGGPIIGYDVALERLF